ncbi:peptidase family C50-domain-containing protein [Cyathus striatus]|nr:peptidase family C50-domain-containing protein [Cyathus striatus]
MASIATKKVTRARTGIKAAKSSTTNVSITTDQLATELASKLTIASTASKPNRRTREPLASTSNVPERETTDEEKRVNSMRAVNAASQTLSGIVQSGWKRSAEGKDKATLANAISAATLSAKHLGTLRRIAPGNVDVERAAISVLGKLVSLEMYEAAYNALADLYPRLCAILDAAPSKNVKSFLHLLSLPIPTVPPTNSIILTLISTYLAYSFSILTCPSSLPSSNAITHEQLAIFVSNSDNSTILHWIPLFAFLPVKHVDAVLMRAYTAIMRFCSSYPSNTAPSDMNAVVMKKSTSVSRGFKLPVGSAAALELIFNLRSYALSCLIHTSPGAVAPNMFWDQAVRSAATVIKALPPNDSDIEMRVTQLVLQRYAGFLECAQKRGDAANFTNVNSQEGKGFVSFCEYWMAFARRGGDICVLERIGNLVKSESPTATSSTTLPAKNRLHAANIDSDMKMASVTELTPKQGESFKTQDDTLALKGARICASLTQITAVLDVIGGKENVNGVTDQELVQKLEDSVVSLDSSSYLSTLIVPISNDVLECMDKKEIDDIRRIGGKVDRAFEKVRRTANKALEAYSSSSHLTSVQKFPSVIRKVLELCVSSLQRALPSAQKAPAISDIVTRLLDTLFVLSRTTLQVEDPRTYMSSYDYLSQGKSVLLGLCTSQDNYACSANMDIGNFIRCLSGAFHNMSGSLYQAGRYGHAIPFLRESCTLGVTALYLREQQGEIDQDQAEENMTKEADGWKQLTEQLYRRWELLGVCYAKNGDRKNAFSSFRRSVYTFPYTNLGIASQSDSLPCTDLFSSSSQVKQIMSIVDRVTYMGACELFLSPEEVSLRPSDIILDSRSANSSSQSEDPQPPKVFFDPRIIGLLLERQLKSLESCRWKEGVKPIYSKILKDLGATYRDTIGERMPIRRARVILKWIEFVFSADSDEKNEGMEGSITDVEEVALEVKRLLSNEDLGMDVNLKTYVPQYSAMVDLWLALHTHKQQNTGQISLVTAYVDEACKTLKELISTESLSPRKNKESFTANRKVTSPKVRIAKMQKIPAAPRKLAAKRREPVTPKPQLKAAQAIKSVARPPSPIIEAGTNHMKQRLAVDTFSELLHLLQSVGSILGLLSLVLQRARVLSVTRKLCERHAGITSDGYVMASIDLAHDYVQLGKTKAARIIFNQTLAAIQSGQCSDEVCTTFFLRFSEAMVAAEDISGSSSAYCEALSRSCRPDNEEKGLSTFQRILSRVMRLEKAAMASHVFSLIQYCRDDVPPAFEAMHQSLRLWNRAVDNLHRLNPSIKPEIQPDHDPFDSRDESRKNTSSSGKAAATYRRPKDAFEWRISEGLLVTLFSLNQMYLNRGSPREAEYFAQQAQSLAESLNAPAALGRALAKKGEVSMQLGKLEEGYTYLLSASQALHDIPGIDIMNIYRLQAEYKEKTEHFQDAELIYARTAKMLEELTFALSQVDGPRKSLGKMHVLPEHKDTLVPQLLAAILRHYVWLLRQERDAAFDTALNQLLSLPHSSRIKIEENSLLAKLNLQDAYERCHGDMFLSSLAESTVALPVGMRSNGAPVVSVSARNVLDLLETVRRIYWENLSLTTNRGYVWDMRESAIVLSLVSTLEVSLGNSEPEGGAMVVASLLDAASGITLRRDMVETIQQKFPVFSDDLKWPVLRSDGTPTPKPLCSQTSKAASLNFSDDEVDEDSEECLVQEYWNSILQRHQGQRFDSVTLSSQTARDFPTNWTVIHISVTEDRNTLFLSRQEGGTKSKPLVFRVPLQGRRDNGGEEEEERLTFQDAIEELKTIINLSNDGTKAAAHVKSGDEAARINWWKQRAALDTRMKELLENIEFCWLGAFKTILSPRPHLSAEAIENLRTQFQQVFQHCLQLKDKKSKSKLPPRKKASSKITPAATQVSLDDNMVERFSVLSPKCQDEELEDLIYFVLDLYQFHGIPVAIAEVDIAQAVVDLRSVLEEHAQKNDHRCGSSLKEVDEDEHIFLILDKNLQGIPWESIPILRGRSVSRIPNLDFLQDRVQFIQWRRSKGSMPVAHMTDEVTGAALVLNPRKGYFILNPSGDLLKTEERFRGWAEGMQKIGWTGTIGKPVSEQQFTSALKTNDLVIYFGHGGAEQYVRSHKIRNLSSCAATMLWGCSSGILQDMGDFDRIGTPLNYMLAGCPTLVANLWDVTDRDIDKFSQTVFDKMHLTPEDISRESNDSTLQTMSVVSAVAESRDVCKLKYLTGAAPVVYGIPFYL